MAKFRVNLPDTDVYAGVQVFDGPDGQEARMKICEAGAAVLLQRLREWLTVHTNDPNENIRGALADSLRVQRGMFSVFVGPAGRHHGSKARRTRAEGYRRAKTGQGKGRTNKSSHHGMAAAVSARDVGYYLEFGTPRMEAKHWMQNVVEESADEVTAAMAAAWDDYLKTKGL